jgi:formylglycine-generating enzyme required for sulfatase activity
MATWKERELFLFSQPCFIRVPSVAKFFLGSLILAGLGCRNDGNSPAPVDMPPTIKTKSGVEMVHIPADFFEMGSRQGREDEKPVHKVWIDAFLMDKFEVTQAEYERLGKIEAFPNPSHFKGPDLPVEQVNWPQAARFCNARSRLEGFQPCYNEDNGECNFEANGYRLPTEAEWEYACRAGTASDYSFGNETRKLGDFAWFADNAGKKTHPVGQKRPNPWGLCDMHGNVAEWCQDVYDKNYYQGSPGKNPRGPGGEKEYVLRGGSWKSAAEALRSSYRLGESPGFSDACLARDAIGFRCVRKLPN